MRKHSVRSWVALVRAVVSARKLVNVDPLRERLGKAAEQARVVQSWKSGVELLRVFLFYLMPRCFLGACV